MRNDKVYIITGRQGSGKTSFLNQLITELQNNNIKVGGFIAEGTWKDDKRFGFNIIRIRDRFNMPLCSKEFNDAYLQFGHFNFNPAAISFGNEILNQDKEHSDIIVVDEIGIFELEEKVWYDSFKQLLNNYSNSIIISVREKIIEKVIEKFELNNVHILKATSEIENAIATITSGMDK